MSIENSLNTASVVRLLDELNNTPDEEGLVLLRKYIMKYPNLLKLKSDIIVATQEHSEHFNLLNLISKAKLDTEKIFTLLDWVLSEYSKNLDATLLRYMLPRLSTNHLDQLWASRSAELKEVLSVYTEEDFIDLVNRLDQAYVGISEGRGRAHWVQSDKA